MLKEIIANFAEKELQPIAKEIDLRVKIIIVKPHGNTLL